MPDSDAAKLLMDFTLGGSGSSGGAESNLPDYRCYITQRDDIVESLDELGGLLRRLAQVQGELRKTHLERKKTIAMETASARTVLTIGEGNVLAEMKLANDALKWRLRQKQAALEASATIIDNLKLRNRELIFEMEALRQNSTCAQEASAGAVVKQPSTHSVSSSTANSYL